MKFQELLLILILLCLFLSIISKYDVKENFYQETIQQPTLNLFKQVPNYLSKIVKDRNNEYLVYEDNTRQDKILDDLENEIEKLAGMITSLSVPITNESVEKPTLKTNFNLDYDKNHFYQ